jgi:ABC-2 type transport system ATP-binding protein
VTRPAVLETFGLGKSFGKKKAVVDVSLRLCEGETFGFLGENGAGKSTFVQMVCGVLAPDRGEVELLGRRARRVPSSWRALIGYVAQEPRFDPWMTAVELGGFIAPFFPGHDKAYFGSLLRRLDVPPQQRIETLSLGQRARLAVAAALAHRPRLLILDEPTAGLDPLARRELHALLLQTAAAHPRATFFSSHIVDDVLQLANRVGVLDGGALVYDGTPGDLAGAVRRVAAADRGLLPPEARVLADHGEFVVVQAGADAWRAFAATPVFAAYDASPDDAGVVPPPPSPRYPPSTPLGFEEALLALLAARRAA